MALGFLEFAFIGRRRASDRRHQDFRFWKVRSQPVICSDGRLGMYLHIHASWKTLLCQTRRLQNTIINRSHRFGISYQINRQRGSGFRKQECVTEVDRPWTFDGGVSRVFLYLFMIRVYISPQAQVFAVYSSPSTADVGGKTKRDGWTAFCDRPWPGYSILGLPQDLYPFIKPGPIDHL